MSDIYSQHRKAAKSAKNISVISQFSPPTYADSIRSKRPNVYTRRMWYNMGSILLCLAMRQHRKACNESTKETRHVSIISSPFPLGTECSKCGEHQRRKHSSWCNSCHNAYKRQQYTPTKGRDRNLYANHRIRLEEYETMLFWQGGVCAVCKKPEKVIDSYTKKPKSLAVDHNHETGQVRELLCSICNSLLGYIEQDRERVRQLV